MRVLGRGRGVWEEEERVWWGPTSSCGGDAPPALSADSNIDNPHHVMGIALAS